MKPPKPDKGVVTDYQSAVRGLVDRPWLRSSQHRDFLRFTDYSLCAVELVDFVGRLLRKAARMGIPLYCESCSYDIAFIRHGRRWELHSKEWEVIAHLGVEIAQQYGLDVRWGGLQMPRCWMTAGTGPLSPPPRV